MVKRKPHHSLSEIKAKFASPATLEITTTALLSATASGLDRNDIIAVVQALARTDFVKSETAHRPPNSKVWHDSYRVRYRALYLYLKFAGETLIDLVLVSLKEV